MQTDERRPPSGDDPLQEPLRRILGRLGDAAGPPTTFDELTVPSVDQTTVAPVDRTTVASVDQETDASVHQTTVAPVDRSTVARVDEEAVSSVDQTAVASVDRATIASVSQETVPSVDHPTFPSLDHATVASLDHATVASVDTAARWALGAAAAVLLIVAALLVIGRDDRPADRLATETATETATTNSAAAAASPATSPSSGEGTAPDSAASPTTDITASPTTPTTASPSPDSSGASTTVTVEPGRTVTEIRDAVVATGLVTTVEFDAALANAQMPSSLGGPRPFRLVSQEGLLGVGTHPVTADAGDLVAGMIERFEVTATEVGLADAAVVIEDVDGTPRVLSPYQLVIVASLVEAETTVDAERPRIARVILNRLAAGELLAIDSALVYALGRPIETQADLEINSPYNLRLYPGLPPSPIGAPSRASLAAAVDPEPGDWLFYVRTDEDGPGTHRFTADLDEFTEGVELCIARQLGCGRTLPED